MWSPQRYLRQGKALGFPAAVLKNAVEQIEGVISRRADAPAILSLNHLAERVGVPYGTLRLIVARQRDPYRRFTIRKRSGGRRAIRVPEAALMRLQRWLVAYVLNPLPVHPSSFAFKPGSSIIGCAARHCGARWLVKMDIAGFFHSISEIQVYRVFLALGYQRLVAFELARLTTFARSKTFQYRSPRWQTLKKRERISDYSHPHLGFLPQGAPTSPMLSNLVMREVDEQIATASGTAGLTYTRYSDDLTFSTRDESFNRANATKFIGEVTRILVRVGLYPQARKTVIVPPGGRKIVLGLLVHEDLPHLPREFRDRLRMHVYYLEKVGPVEHAKARGFETVWGLKNHIRGLIDFSRMIDPTYGDALLERFKAVDWPI
jgi:RNA-directed DNA polymerase